MAMKSVSHQVLLVLSVLSLCAVGYAQPPVPNYQLVTTIQLPGGLAGFDIAWLEPSNQRFYLADRTATKGTGRIDVVDTQNNKLLYTIPTNPSEIGFTGTVPAVTAGCSISGPNGVVGVPQMNQLYVGDGDSTVKVVDLVARAVVAIIPTGGKCRADELAYDPLDHIIMIANPSDSPAFLTFISTDTQSVVGHYNYPSTQVGLEQPVWNALTKRFYISVPATNSTLGSVDVFNPLTMLREQSLTTSACSPAGLVLTPAQHLMTSCGVVIDASTGNLVTSTQGVNTDELWYNSGDNRYYFGSPSNAVVDANTNQVIATLPGAAGHTLAVDPITNRVFAPVSGAGIKVFAAQ